MFGTEPTVMSACEPVMTRPSASVTATPSSVRFTDWARAWAIMFTPRSTNTSCRTAEASASSPGITRSRLEISVTSLPIST